MKAIVLTSNSLRHKYFIKKLSENFDVLDIYVQKKRNYYNEAKRSEFVKKHFNMLEKTEKDFFKGEYDFKFNEVDNINDKNIIDKAKRLKPDFIALFGTSILNDEWLNSFDGKIINLHLGLSPFYRGSATLFWPFAYDELECIGATIHIARQRVDSGEIIFRVKPKIEVGDNYYTINYKTIKIGIDSFSEAVKRYLNGEIKPIKHDISNSKLFKKCDFNEEVLKKVLDKYGKNIKHFKKEGKCNF